MIYCEFSRTLPETLFSELISLITTVTMHSKTNLMYVSKHFLYKYLFYLPESHGKDTRRKFSSSWTLYLTSFQVVLLLLVGCCDGHQLSVMGSCNVPKNVLQLLRLFVVALRRNIMYSKCHSHSST